jgi:very-short-patch-repair endonuclease
MARAVSAFAKNNFSRSFSELKCVLVAGGVRGFPVSPLAGEMSAKPTEGGNMPHREVSPRTRANARRMRRDMTEAERRLWKRLRAHRLMGLGFRRQMPVAGYIADFACAEHKLVVEVDGSQHDMPAIAIRDSMRTKNLGQTGWTVVRFWNIEIMQALDDVCEHIVAIAVELGADFANEGNEQ